MISQYLFSVVIFLTILQLVTLYKLLHLSSATKNPKSKYDKLLPTLNKYLQTTIILDISKLLNILHTHRTIVGLCET